jgi:hypothetical protein
MFKRLAEGVGAVVGVIVLSAAAGALIRAEATQKPVLFVSENAEVAPTNAACGMARNLGKDVEGACFSMSPHDLALGLGVTIRNEVVTSPGCAGVEFVWFTGNEHIDVSASWQLYVSYIPGRAKQAWYLYGPDKSRIASTDTVREMVVRACTAVSGRGGTLRSGGPALN